MTTSLKTPKPLPLSRQKSLLQTEKFRVMTFILLHIPLAFILDISGWLGAIHALAVFLYGLKVASRRQTTQVIAVLGYITGAEILWRMTGARILWEHGKYASTLLAFFALLVAHRAPLLHQSSRKLRGLNPAIFFYLALLLPSLILTVSDARVTNVRNNISFNLSGPLALTVLALYLWQRPITKKGLVYFLIALVAPIVGILTRAGWHTITADTLRFTLNSNLITSGGYGPNQVANILGLGSLACIILLVLLWPRLPFRLFFSALSALFLFQAILTFSRGGVYSCILTAIVFIFHLLKSPQVRNQFAFLVIVGLLLGWYAGVPSLDQITSNVWQSRFSSLDTTGRLELAMADWQTFLDHPLVGVGVGLSRQFRPITIGNTAAPHTELSRSLAEHGLLGVLSYLIIFALVAVNYLRNKPGMSRALTATFAVWSFSIMVHSGMRFVAISLGIALAMAAWQVSLDDAIWEEP